MPKFAANLTMLFTEHEVIDRFAAARAEGFEAVEFLFPYDHDIDAIERVLAEHQLEMILFNLPVGNFAAGDRGFANDPSRISEFEQGARRTIELAQRLGTPMLNCLVGKRLSNVPESEQLRTLVGNLQFAAEEAALHGIRLLIEPLNTIDTPGFLIATASEGIDLIDEVGHENLWLQFDVYHEQRMAGNLVATLYQYSDRIAHIQVADSPLRHQPGTGEINYRYVFDAIDEIGYEDWVSLEFVPSPNTSGALADMRQQGLLPDA